MKAPLIHVASMIFNEPLAILPEKLEAILRAIGPRLTMDEDGITALLAATEPPPQPAFNVAGVVTTGSSATGVITYPMQPILLVDPVPVDPPQPSKPYKLTADGIATIPVRGTLMKRFSFMSAASGCSSYASLGEAAMAAQADPNVKAILLDVDSPGGTTHGCFELSDLLFGLRGDKPIWAIANDLAASAAYALASAADRVILTRTAGVGSIGVFALHADLSGQDDLQGIKFTYVYAGSKKVDGNPHEPLSKSAKADIQAEVDREYEMFVECVARNRDMWPQKVRNTEAMVLFGDTALGKLADECMSYDEAYLALLADVTQPKLQVTDAARQRLAEKMTVASQTNSDNNTPNDDSMTSGRQEGTKGEMPAIPPHKTATSEKPWDGGRAEKNLRQGEPGSYYRKEYAWQDPKGDATTKAAYKFPHHEVSSGGDIGAANIKACQSGISALNGGRGGHTLSGPDRRGVYRHVAKHLKDADLEPAPLAHYSEYIAGVLEEALAQDDQQRHALALEYLLVGDEEPTTEQEAPMPIDTEAKRAKAAAEEEEKKSQKKDDEKDDEEEDDDEKEPNEDDDDKKKDAARKGRKAEAVAESRRSTNEAGQLIAALCIVGGCPELAATYIAEGKTISEVRAALNERRAKASEATGVHSYVTGQPSQGSASIEQIVQQVQVASAPFNDRRNPAGYAEAQLHAFKQAMQTNPQIYDSYLEERDIAITKSPGGRGPAINEFVYKTQMRFMANLQLSTAVDTVPGRK